MASLVAVQFRDCVMQKSGLPWVDRYPTYYDDKQQGSPGVV